MLKISRRSKNRKGKLNQRKRRRNYLKHCKQSKMFTKQANKIQPFRLETFIKLLRKKFQRDQIIVKMHLPIRVTQLNLFQYVKRYWWIPDQFQDNLITTLLKRKLVILMKLKDQVLHIRLMNLKWYTKESLVKLSLTFSNLHQKEEKKLKLYHQ